MRLTINLTKNMRRLAIDSAVHNSVSAFSKEFGDKEGLAYRVAKAAAETAVEQFGALINHELRMLEIHYEQQADLRRFIVDPSVVVATK